MIAALIIFGVAIAAALLYGAVRLGDRPSRAEARQFEASLDDWHWRPAPPAAEVHHDWYAAPTITLAPEDPPAGDEDPGPDGLPEGDTQLLWPPQEAPGPGDPLTPLEKARAAMDEVKATPLADYLDEVGEATAYGDDAPFTNWLSQDTITRGFAAIKAEVAP